MNRLALLLLALASVSACTSVPDRRDSEQQLQEEFRNQRFNRLVVTIRDNSVGQFKQSYRVGRPIAFLVTADDLRKQFLDKSDRVSRDLGLRLVDSYPVERLGLYTLVYEADDSLTLANAARVLRNDARIQSVTPVSTYRTQTGPEQDPLAEVLPGVQPDTLDAMHAIARGEGVRIAIIDTGVDIAHEDLPGDRIAVSNMVNSEVVPPESHGTTMAGLISAVENNGIGTRGIAPQARIIALRACWEEPDEPTAICGSDTIAKSLVFALDAQVDIVNLSLTGPMDPLLQQLVNALLEDGIMVIAAYPDEAGQGPFPAKIPGVIAVTANVSKQQLTESNAPIYMPGRNILSLLPGNRYGPQQGSSISAAQVSALAALFKERQSELQPMAFRQLLLDAGLTSGNDLGLVRALSGLDIAGRTKLADH